MEYDARPAPWRVGLPVNEDPSLPPVASGAFYTDGTFWSAAGVAVAVLVGLGAIWAMFRSTHPRLRLNYTVLHGPLVPLRMDGGLEIRRNGTLLTDPHYVEVVLTNPGRRDIPSGAFDRGDPFWVHLDVSYLEVLRTESSPGSTRVPQAQVYGSHLSIGPGLISCGTTITYVLLVDTAPAYNCHHSLVDVKVQQVPVTPPRRTALPSPIRTP
ncbi:hypothetical protein AB0I00_05365 [Streptomyces sp. NPDC050803]|uniref:hypothetical protein n=1 Tax=unclassified Streptomyces TaxID=2593676 RepID=UPI00344A641A